MAFSNMNPCRQVIPVGYKSRLLTISRVGLPWALKYTVSCHIIPWTLYWPPGESQLHMSCALNSTRRARVKQPVVPRAVRRYQDVRENCMLGKSRYYGRDQDPRLKIEAFNYTGDTRIRNWVRKSGRLRYWGSVTPCLHQVYCAEAKLE